jgi:hypothetical protein
MATVDDSIIRLEPPRASLGELQLTNKLEMRRVDSDVLGVVEHLQRIDPGLKMFYDEGQEVFVLYWEGYRADEHGVFDLHEDLIGAYKELDQRLIKLIERIDAQGRGRTDLSAELERMDREHERRQEAERYEKVGQLGEKLMHAVRDDLGLNGSKAFMSGSREKHRQRKRRKR